MNEPFHLTPHALNGECDLTCSFCGYRSMDRQTINAVDFMWHHIETAHPKEFTVIMQADL